MRYAVRISDDNRAVTVFLKQYGAQRTGTNYLRILLQKNYSDACMLMHVLGDKHSPPAPLDEIWMAAQAEADPSLAFVSNATFLHPSLSTSQRSARQHEELRRVAGPLAEAYRNRSLGFVVSIKNPYAWAVSIAMYEGVIRRGATLMAALTEFVRLRCSMFNQRYHSWLELTARNPSRALIVRHEDLVGDPECVLGQLDETFALRRAGPFVDEPRAAPMILWDDTNEPAGDAFDRSYYLEKRYLDRLSPEALQTVTATIDWELMRAFGYFPL